MKKKGVAIVLTGILAFSGLTAYADVWDGYTPEMQKEEDITSSLDWQTVENKNYMADIPDLSVTNKKAIYQTKSTGSYDIDEGYSIAVADGTATLADIIFKDSVGTIKRPADGIRIIISKYYTEKVSYYEQNTDVKEVISFPAKAYVVERGEDDAYSTTSVCAVAALGVNYTLTKGCYRITIGDEETLKLLTAENDKPIGARGFIAPAFELVLTGSGNTVELTDDAVWLPKIIEAMETGSTYEEAKDIAWKYESDALQEAHDIQKQWQQNWLDSKSIELKLNGVAIPTDSPPVIQNGRTMVPMRAFVEAMGYSVVWTASTKTIDVYDPYTTKVIIRMQVGSKNAKYATGPKGQMSDAVLDAPPVIINGRVMVPARFISQTLGYNVQWDANTKTVNILYKG